MNGVTPVKVEGIPLIHVCSLFFFFFLGSVFYLDIHFYHDIHVR